MVAKTLPMADTLPKPRAIVLISAHWEANEITIQKQTAPDLIYDYYGFPEESYSLTYPAPGAPDLADQIQEAFTQAGLSSSFDTERGYDHGVFVPLKLMYPDADIPVVQVSLLNSLDAQTHIRLGAALAPLRQDNIMIVGSGFTFHNLSVIRKDRTAEDAAAAQDFTDWIDDIVMNETIDQQTRVQHLMAWEQAPSAHFSHPRSEHLMPLHVCMGAAGKAADQVIAFDVMRVPGRHYIWR